MPIDIIARGLAAAQGRALASTQRGKGAALILTEEGENLQKISAFALGAAPVLPSGGDDTAALQAALSAGCLILAKGGVYRVTTTLTCPANRSIVVGNNARVVVDFGTKYARPLFQKDKTRDVNQILVARDLVIRGNCTVFDFRFPANNPGAGLKLKAACIDFNTLDGNLREGTR